MAHPCRDRVAGAAAAKRAAWGCFLARTFFSLLIAIVAATSAAADPPSADGKLRLEVVSAAEAAPGRRLQNLDQEPRPIQLRIPHDAYDRTSMAGRAKGASAGGQPSPIQGLAQPDRPDLGEKSASMEGEALVGCMHALCF